LDLVTYSVLTTRRFDALKLWLSLRVLGRAGFADIIDRIVDLTRDLAEALENPRFEVLHESAFSCLVFRYVPKDTAADADGVNVAIPRTMFARGLGVIGYTVVRGQPALKLTLLHPCTELHELIGLLERVIAVGEELEQTVCAVV